MSNRRILHGKEWKRRGKPLSFFGGCNFERQLLNVSRAFNVIAIARRRNPFAACAAKDLAQRQCKWVESESGFEVDIAWRSGRLVNAIIRSIWGTKGKLRYGMKVKSLSIRRGQALRFDESLRSS